MLQGALRPALRPAGATLAAAAAFGISHAVIARSPAGLLTALPALCFGAARERQQSLLGPVVLHAAANVALAAWSAPQP
jgi:membrane protease YdiL (CAAX protease family)